MVEVIKGLQTICVFKCLQLNDLRRLPIDHSKKVGDCANKNQAQDLKKHVEALKLLSDHIVNRKQERLMLERVSVDYEQEQFISAIVAPLLRAARISN